MTEDLISFGAWVRLRRQALVLARETLAARIGVAEVTIRKIEADERRPSPQVAALLAQHLQLADDERERFVQVARGVLPVDRLPPPIPGRTPVPAAPALPPVVPQSLALPSGTVTFLFTDIEGSTRRWEQEPAAMRRALARHEALLREVVEAHGGQVFKTVGDGVCAAFADAPSAIRAALDGQRALLDEAWETFGLRDGLRVRMALHSGSAQAEDGDYLGPPLNRVARLLAAGHGGQILLSLATQELVRETLPGDVRLIDLGRHRLKDLSQPEVIAQLATPDLPAEFPALHTLDARVGYLPSQLTELIGREAEMAQLSAQIRDGARLLTLTGPGGTGKTRLALQVAAEVADAFPDGVWFVDLSSASDRDTLLQLVAQVLGVAESLTRSLDDGLLAWASGRRALLILDNCEQVVDAASTTASLLLRGAPQLQLLVTSRVPLRISGEREASISPLALPSLAALDVMRLSQYESVRLFIERARAIQPAFAVTDANAPAVAEICVRLDGLPLAIELAAARVRLFAPEQLLHRLSTARLQTLSGGPRDLPARQQTIRAAIDWSYHLLARDEQTLFARLGVFVGGWTLEAAEAVCGGDDLDVIAGLESLVAHSLVRQIETGGEVRFGMLETIREYAVERLTERGEGKTLHQQHAEFFTELAERAEPKLRGAEQHAALAELDADLENLRAALVWSIDDGQAVELGFRLAAALWYYWCLRNRFAEGMSWLTHPRGRSEGIPTRLRMWLLIGAAWLQRLAYHSASALADQLATEGLQLARDMADSEGVVAACVVLITNDYVSNRHDARVDEGLRLTQAHASTWWQAQMLCASAQRLYFVARQESERRSEAGLKLARESGDSWLLVRALHVRAIVLGTSSERAKPLLADVVRLARRLEDWVGLAWALHSQAGNATAQGAFDEVRKLLDERLTAERLAGNIPGIVGALEDAGILAHRLGDLERAAALAEEALRLAPLGESQRSVAGAALACRVFLDQGHYEQALAIAEQGITTARKYEDAHATLHFAWLTAYTHLIIGDFDKSSHFQSLYHNLAQDMDITHARGFLHEIDGLIARHRNELVRARNDFEVCLSVRRASSDGEDVNIIWTTFQLSMVEFATQNDERARLQLQECLHFHRVTPFMVDIPLMLEGSAAVIAASAPSDAPRLWGAATALRERLGAPMWPVDRPEYERRVAACRAALGAAAFDAAWAAGQALTWEQAVDEALVALSSAAS